MGYHLSRRPQILFPFVLVFVCLSLCDCENVGLWACEFVDLCGCEFVSLWVSVLCVCRFVGWCLCLHVCVYLRAVVLFFSILVCDSVC